MPLIVHWPGRIERGQVSDLPTYFPDALPTLGQLAGAGLPTGAKIDGISIAPELMGRTMTEAAARAGWPKGRRFR